MIWIHVERVALRNSSNLKTYENRVCVNLHGLIQKVHQGLKEDDCNLVGIGLVVAL